MTDLRSLIDLLQNMPRRETGRDPYGSFLTLLQMIQSMLPQPRVPELGVTTPSEATGGGISSYRTVTVPTHEVDVRSGLGTTTPSETGGGGLSPAPTKTVRVPIDVGEGVPEYTYRVYDQPFTGDPRGLVTRRGLTLQRGPMRSLMEIARMSDVLPGTQEITKILPSSFRTYQDQVRAAATNPYAAAPGQSYHQQGLAIDAGWWSQDPVLRTLLEQAGWNRFAPSYEPWHWSYGVTG